MWRPVEEEEDDRINLSSILGIFFSGGKKRAFEPQVSYFPYFPFLFSSFY